MNARAILEERRKIELEVRVLRRQIEACLPTGAPAGYRSGPRAERVPGTDEYTYIASRTNNPTGAAYQHADGYAEALERLLQKKQEVLLAAEACIERLGDSVARTILRYYYCLAWPDDKIGHELECDGRTICKRRHAALKWLDMQ